MARRGGGRSWLNCSWATSSDESLSSFALLEADYERLLLSHGADLFPEMRLVPFKKPVSFAGEVRQPDLALIDRSYRSWFVVEVELAHHSLEGLVLPQVEVFFRATYGSEDALYLASKSEDLSLPQLEAMMRGAQPQVLVIVNTLCPDWIVPLARFDALLTVVEVFRSGQNRHILRLNGEQPRSVGNRLSLCHFDPTFPRFLTVQSPAQLPTGNDPLGIDFDGAMTWWRRVDLHDRVWLSPVGSPLPDNVGTLEILRHDDGRMAFRRAPIKKR